MRLSKISRGGLRMASGTFPRLGLEVSGDMLIVWTTFTAYGRLHHITKALEDAEKELQKVHADLLDRMGQQKIAHTGVSDVYYHAIKNDPQMFIGEFYVKGHWDTDFDKLLERGGKPWAHYIDFKLDRPKDTI